MMRSIAIGLAAVAIAIGGSTLSASALHGQKSGISKGNVSRSVKHHRFGPRTYGFYEEERLTPREREHARRIMREGFAELTPREREHLRGAIRERVAGLTSREREHLRGVVRERLAELTPRERAYLRGIIRERLAELSPRERADLRRIERERLYRHGPYGLR
jgi:FixJ family two-component response regulator